MDEILSIIAHELGHWKQMHLYKGAIVDSFYMLIFGVFISFLVNDANFLGTVKFS